MSQYRKTSYKEGYEAFWYEVPFKQNPYHPQSFAFREWRYGWRDAFNDYVSPPEETRVYRR